jgi:hypothetical protein
MATVKGEVGGSGTLHVLHFLKKEENWGSGIRLPSAGFQRLLQWWFEVLVD